MTCAECGPARKPEVYWDEGGWTCDQTMFCLRCRHFWYRTLADRTSWADAMNAGNKFGQPVRPELATAVGQRMVFTS